jgi:hypothetical protein
MVNKKEINEAYIHLRKTNQSISDETLDFMKNVSLAVLERQENPILKETLKDTTKELTLKCTVGSDSDGFYGIKDLASDKVIIPNPNLCRGGLYEVTINRVTINRVTINRV